MGDAALVQAVLADWRVAPVSDKLRAVLGFLEKLTLRPDEVGADDIHPLIAAGTTVAEMEDAIHICAMFNAINRVSNSLGFAVDSPADFARAAPGILKFGYRLPGLRRRSGPQ